MEDHNSPSPPLPPSPARTQTTSNPLPPPPPLRVRSYQDPFVAAAPPPQEPPPTPTSRYEQDQKRPGESRSRARSGAASRPSPVVHNESTPIKDAVNTAFDQSLPTSQLDPHFMKKLTEQVTEQVIKNLQAVNLGGPTPTASVQPQNIPFASASYSPSQVSPLRSSTESFPPRFTPPSPLQERDGRVRSVRHDSQSPHRAPSDAGSNHSRESKESRGIGDSRKSRASTKRARDATPRASQSDVIDGLRRSKTTHAGKMESMVDERSRRRGSDADSAYRQVVTESESGYFDGAPRSRTRPLPVFEDEEEATTLEKIWQPLFDNGNPTIRLGQFLRGLAKHLIDDYEPNGSLVITPAKMLRFLEETKVTEEYYPWATIFGGKMSHTSISMMYRKLLCQHHIVQQQVHDVPSIPALTPLGFETFMTCMIQAHPDTEFERLSRAIKDMPISNADDKTERFPKELSRRLLPGNANVQAEQRIISSLNHETVLVPLERGISAMPPPPTSAPPPQSSFTERERNPYFQSSSNALEDEDLAAAHSLPIERERKPYFGKEGKGMRYDVPDERDHLDRESSAQTSREACRPSTSRYRPGEYSGRNSRTNSGVPPQAMYNRTDAVNIPSGSRNRMPGPPSQPPTGSVPKGNRRSPPPRGFRSEPEVGNIPTSQYASNLHPEDATQFYNGRRPERNAPYADETSGRNGPPPQSGYDSGYPSGQPRDSFRGAGIQDDRRRSWYPGMAPGMQTGGGAPGGTDGYGSYAGGNGSSQY